MQNLTTMQCDRVDSISELNEQNQALRRLLQTLTQDAAYNESVMQRFQEREMALLSASDLPHLIERLTTGLLESFSLDQVRLVLLDPYGVLEELLSNLGLDPQTLPHLHLTSNVRATLQPYPDLHKPWLGTCDQAQQDLFFPTCQVASLALLPLRQPDGLAGFLHLGSHDAKRFSAEYGTAFLHRLAQLAAVCLENAVNRERLRLTGLTDGLTGLYNRRHLDKRLHEEVTRACRHRQPLSCLFIDADHFKQINDQYGHAAGDQVLIALAKRIREQLRGCDLAARYGGEEIVVLLPQTDAQNSSHLAERIRAYIADTPVTVDDGSDIQVSVSIGVAQMADEYRSPARQLAAQLLGAADTQLYQAKTHGRNRVCCADQ